MFGFNLVTMYVWAICIGLGVGIAVLANLVFPYDFIVVFGFVALAGLVNYLRFRRATRK